MYVLLKIHFCKSLKKPNKTAALDFQVSIHTLLSSLLNAQRGEFLSSVTDEEEKFKKRQEKV